MVGSPVENHDLVAARAAGHARQVLLAGPFHENLIDLLLRAARTQRCAGDFRFYSGALDGATVEALRASVVPEPTALAILGLAVVAGALRRRCNA